MKAKSWLIEEDSCIFSRRICEEGKMSVKHIFITATARCHCNYLAKRWFSLNKYCTNFGNSSFNLYRIDSAPRAMGTIIFKEYILIHETIYGISFAFIPRITEHSRSLTS